MVRLWSGGEWLCDEHGSARSGGCRHVRGARMREPETRTGLEIGRVTLTSMRHAPKQQQP